MSVLFETFEHFIRMDINTPMLLLFHYYFGPFVLGLRVVETLRVIEILRAITTLTLTLILAF